MEPEPVEQGPVCAKCGQEVPERCAQVMEDGSVCGRTRTFWEHVFRNGHPFVEPEPSAVPSSVPEPASDEGLEAAWREYDEAALSYELAVAVLPQYASTAEVEAARRAVEAASRRPLVEAASELIANMGTCHCDESYTARGRHEGTCYYGQFEVEIEAVQALLSELAASEEAQ